jgi:hypothetical protein
MYGIETDLAKMRYELDEKELEHLGKYTRELITNYLPDSMLRTLVPGFETGMESCYGGFPGKNRLDIHISERVKSRNEAELQISLLILKTMPIGLRAMA